jgi:hypothetical protein
LSVYPHRASLKNITVTSQKFQMINLIVSNEFELKNFIKKILLFYLICMFGQVRIWCRHLM